MAIKQYGDLNEIRTEICNKLVQNQDLIKFLFYTKTDDDKKDITTLPQVTGSDRINVIKTQINKHLRINLAQDNISKCYISMDFGKVPRSKEGFWIMPSFSFFIICSEDLIETLNGSRMLALEQCIVNTFDGCTDIKNLGQVRVFNSEPINVSHPYQGRRVDLAVLDWIKQ